MTKLLAEPETPHFAGITTISRLKPLIGVE